MVGRFWVFFSIFGLIRICFFERLGDGGMLMFVIEPPNNLFSFRF